MKADEIFTLKQSLKRSNFSVSRSRVVERGDNGCLVVDFREFFLSMADLSLVRHPGLLLAEIGRSPTYGQIGKPIILLLSSE